MPASPMSCSRTGASATTCARSSLASRRRSLPSTGASTFCRRRRSRASAMPAASRFQVELRDGSTDFEKLQSMTNAVVANAQSQTRAAARRRPRSAPRRRNCASRSTASRRRPCTCRSIRRLFDARHLFGLRLCRAVQQIRPGVSDLCAGRCAIPPAAARHRQSFGAQPARQHDPARHAGESHAGRRPAADQPLQSLSVVDHHRPAGGGLLVRARRSI